MLIQYIHENINEMKINNNTLQYKITFTSLVCKIKYEHTNTLIEDKLCKCFISKQATDNTNFM